MPMSPTLSITNSLPLEYTLSRMSSTCLIMSDSRDVKCKMSKMSKKKQNMTHRNVQKFMNHKGTKFSSQAFPQILLHQMNELTLKVVLF